MEEIPFTYDHTFHDVPLEVRKKKRKRSRNRIASVNPHASVADWEPEIDDPTYPSVRTVSWREEERPTRKHVCELSLLVIGVWLHESWNSNIALVAVELLQRLTGDNHPNEMVNRKEGELALCLMSVLDEYWHPEESCGQLRQIVKYWPEVGNTLRLEIHRNRSKAYSLEDWFQIHQGGLVPSRHTGGSSVRYSSYTKGYGESPKRPSGIAPRVQVLDRQRYNRNTVDPKWPGFLLGIYGCPRAEEDDS